MSRISISLVVVGLVVALGVGNVAGATPLDDARRERNAAQAAAVEAAQRYVDALSEQARLEGEIARLEAEITAMRARVKELRQQLRGRAVSIYQGRAGDSATAMIEANNAMDASRAVHLTEEVAEHDRALAGELSENAKKLAQDEVAVREAKVAQDAAVLHLVLQKAALEAALAASDVAVQTLEAIAESQGQSSGSDADAGRVATGAVVCPVFGPVAFVNDWHAPRSGGRLHLGTDMFATYGTPLLAVVDGTIRWDNDDLGGTGIWLTGDDGVSYYYAHLSKYEGFPRRVAKGDLIGYVGDSGNAKGGPAHLHFGIQSGGQMVNPFPTVRVLCRL
jgi:murein DD-endopeptidase MepM/ murein hydrolase activator NlpD